jgi:hypothetical protein
MHIEEKWHDHNSIHNLPTSKMYNITGEKNVKGIRVLGSVMNFTIIFLWLE